MEIIKKGNPHKKLYQFSCKKCRTIYRANEDEVLQEFWRNEETFQCNCPVCNQVNYTDKDI